MNDQFLLSQFPFIKFLLALILAIIAVLLLYASAALVDGGKPNSDGIEDFENWDLAIAVDNFLQLVWRFQNFGSLECP